ncbi:hypothetical protein M8494_00545 [Serratia ureilytica]
MATVSRDKTISRPAKGRALRCWPPWNNCSTLTPTHGRWRSKSTETLGPDVLDVSDPSSGDGPAVEQVAYATHNFLLIGSLVTTTPKKRRQAIEQLVRHRCEALVVHAKV